MKSFRLSATLAVSMLWIAVPVTAQEHRGASIDVGGAAARYEEHRFAPRTNRPGGNRTETPTALARQVSLLQRQLDAMQQQLSELQNRSQPGVSEVSQPEEPLPESVPVPAYEEPSPSAAEPAHGPQHWPSGWEFAWDDHKWIKIGAGLRTSYNIVEDAALNGSSPAHDINLDNMRFFFNGQANEYIGLTFNTDINNAQGFQSEVQALQDSTGFRLFEDAGEVRVLDAIARFEFNDLFNIWIGRFNLPIDRQQIDGPYFINGWSFPFVALGYHDLFQGRDDGLAYWGQLNEGMLKWKVGVFDGRDDFPNIQDNPALAARMTLNLLDPEPGYYTKSTYYGEKDILAIGAAVFHQSNAFGTIAAPADLTGFNIDVLFERRLALLGDGVFTFETAFYEYNTDGAGTIEVAPDVLRPQSREGDSFLVVAAYLFPDAIGPGFLRGQPRPFVRYQDYDRNFATDASPMQQIDLGIGHVIDGHDARLTAVWENQNPGSGERFNTVRMGVQVQY